MILAIQFLSPSDLYLFPLCLGVLLLINRSISRRRENHEIRSVYKYGFLFKAATALVYTAVVAVVFKGGDTALFYQGIQDLRTAVKTEPALLWKAFTTHHLAHGHPLAIYFYFDGYTDDTTFNYMLSASNLFVPRLGLLPSYIFGNSFLCITLCFSFFAFTGSMRLFKTFYHYYPQHKNIVALACVFIPSVGFWSSGLLKDTICFAALGYIVYSVFSIVMLRKKIFQNLCWLCICGYMLYTIKTYIFLILAMSLLVWIFMEQSKLIKDINLKRSFSFAMLLIGGVVGVALYQNLTDAASLQQYQLDSVISSADYSRRAFRQVSGEGSSFYFIDTNNKLTWFLHSIFATFFRPFPWEASSPAALISSIESLIILFLTIYIFLRKGIFLFFKTIFLDQQLLFCFVFAIVFGVGVGASTANFGALSRYKIPAMPFFILVLLMVYVKTGLRFPIWFRWLLGKKYKA